MEGAAFGATSTLVAQLGILVGMIASEQPHSALVIASAASAFSGSFGDAFSMFVSKSTTGDSSLETVFSLLFSKLALGAVYTSLFYILGHKPRQALAAAILLTLLLLIGLSHSMAQKTDQSVETIFMEVLALTGSVVIATSAFGYWIRDRL